MIKNQYYIIQNEKEKHLENIIQKQQSELKKKDKMIDEMAPQIYLTEEQREEMKE